MKETGIDRREALRRLGASVVVPIVAGYHPLVPRQDGDWKPVFFDQREVDTVTALAERIIPETETPGARRANVHQYIDYVLSQDDSGRRERFRSGLVWLDQRCKARFGDAFVALSEARQDEVLASLAQRPSTEETQGVSFFEEIKRLTVDGYYRSEVAMNQELGFEGRAFLTEFPGCNHEEHLSWKRPGD